ncbi:MAG: hypothetical protein R3C68_00845 [Myxococcota bacterium]
MKFIFLGNSHDFLDTSPVMISFLSPRPIAPTAFAREMVRAFDRLIPLYYSREDRERGYIETEDRYNQLRKFPIMSVSIVAVNEVNGRYGSHAEMSETAAHLKKKAKAIAGSVYLSSDTTHERDYEPQPTLRGEQKA